MPFPPDSDSTDSDAQHRPADPRPAGWTQRARTGSAATAVAALAALGAGGAAHAAPGAPVQPTSATVLVGQKSAEAPRHTVSPGDSLWALAQRHGVAVDDLMRWNGLSGAALLVPGQKLVLADPGGKAPGDSAPESKAPESKAPHKGAPAAREHTVRPGDSFWSIAQQHEVSVQQLIDANDLTVSSLLRPGQRLTVAGAPEAVGTAAAPAAEPEQGEPEQAAPEQAVGDSFLGRTYDDPVVESANRHHEQLQARPAPSREEVRQMVHDTAVRMDVDPSLALAHAYQESGFNHRVVSPADAVGTMQVIPDAGAWASGLVGRELDLLDAQDNITAGVAIIRQLGRTAANGDTAIAAYYQGLHGVKKYGMYDDTKKYVKAVKSHRDRFRK
jgi:LysM repeat protein